MITRCYVINGDIDGDCPGSRCHSARRAQPNLPAQRENRIGVLNDHLLVKRRVKKFWNF